ISFVEDNLYFMSKGKIELTSLHVFQSNRFHEMINKFKDKFDYIIIDTAEIFRHSDSIVISKIDEINLLVVSPNELIEQFQLSLKKLNFHNVKIDSCLLNCTA